MNKLNKNIADSHPAAQYVRKDRMPHMWCPGCGIGTAINSFFIAFEKSNYAKNNLAIVSGIGCTGRIAGYVNMDSFHTTHGRAIPFAEGLKAASPETKVVVFSGDGDLASIGGNHFIHAARKNMDITVIAINNSIYGMTGGQVSPTTPTGAYGTTAPYGSITSPFNLPHLAEAAGAVYVARWTVYHLKQMQKAMLEAINKKGFSFLEIISPCPTLFGRKNKLGSGLDRLNFYKEHGVIKNGAATKDIDIKFNEDFIIGKFLDIENKVTHLDAMNTFYDQKFSANDDYSRYQGAKFCSGVTAPSKGGKK